MQESDRSCKHGAETGTARYYRMKMPGATRTVTVTRQSPGSDIISRKFRSSSTIIRLARNTVSYGCGCMTIMAHNVESPRLDPAAAGITHTHDRPSTEPLSFSPATACLSRKCHTRICGGGRCRQCFALITASQGFSHVVQVCASP